MRLHQHLYVIYPNQLQIIIIIPASPNDNVERLGNTDPVVIQSVAGNGKNKIQRS